MKTTKKSDIHFIANDRENDQEFLMISDVHWDSKYCDRKLLKKHCDEAKEKNAGILIFGDIFDAMGGKWDKRSSKKDIRPEYQVEDYFNAIVDDAYDFFKNYPVIFISEGNHESSIKRHHEINLLKMLAQKLDIDHGLYSGFIRFNFIRDLHARIPGGGQSFDLYYTHGGGGNSPVTRGVIKTARRQVMVDADIMVSGHIHNSWDMEIIKLQASKNGYILRKPVRHVSLGTYKDDTLKGGFAAEKEFAPPNLGGYWLKFSHLNSNKTVFNLEKTL